MINKYYQKHKERLQKETREACKNLSDDEKDKRQKRVRERYHNLPEEQKQKPLEYMIDYYIGHRK